VNAEEDEPVTVTTELQTFILEELTPGRGIAAIAPDDDLLSRGIIDSLGVMALVEFLDEQYGVRVGTEDLQPANFRDVRSIEAFIARRRDGAPC
jgi:acyl carrier protein